MRKNGLVNIKFNDSKCKRVRVLTYFQRFDIIYGLRPDIFEKCVDCCRVLFVECLVKCEWVVAEDLAGYSAFATIYNNAIYILLLYVSWWCRFFCDEVDVG